MKRFFFISVFSLAAIVMISCKKDDDKTPDTNTPNATDNSFMTTAAHANRSEVDLGQLALTKSSNDSVKIFAQMLVSDHTAAIASLDSLASAYNITLPTTADSAQLAWKDSLNSYTGYTFDTAFINSQIRTHQQLVAIFQDETTNGNADNIQAYANNHIAGLQAHMQFADSVSANLQ